MTFGDGFLLSSLACAIGSVLILLDVSAGSSLLDINDLDISSASRAILLLELLAAG